MVGDDVMQCRNCPYVKDEFDSRMARYEERVEKEGIPNYVYGYLDPDSAAEEFEECLWCDKTGGKLWWYGRCTDAFHYEKNNKVKSKKRKRSRRERDAKHKQHLKYLEENCRHYPSPVMAADKNGNWIPDKEWYTKFPEYEVREFAYYKRLYRAKRKGNRYTYYKKYSNKRVRRYNGEIHKGNMYRKIFDYWWTVD